ncbi:MAG: tRNA epoxyqueuosine(34) reductase QueG [Hyphomicrobiaceae bacterium]
MPDVALPAEPMAPAALKQFVERESLAAGFEVARVARIADLGDEAGRRLQSFLSERLHGDMDWLERTADRRQHPHVLWPEACSAILLGLSYAPSRDPLEALAAKDRGVISVYAQGSDYHDVLKPRLKRIAGALQRASGADVKVFVDTAPLMEKPLAVLSGLGWQGKHTNLVSRDHGSWLFLGAILTSADLLADAPEIDHCGSCRRCLDICPTAAFPAPYRLDARRCISYLTIEHKGPIDRALRPLIGNRIYGCDDCLAVCPWNKFAAEGREMLFHARAETDNPPLSDLLQLDDSAFRKRFAKTPVKRTGRARFVRNVLIAAGNSGNRNLAKSVELLLRDDSALVRGAAVWSMARLAGGEKFAALELWHRPQESDPTVLTEWDAELS